MGIYKHILEKYWGYSHFRPLQEDIIRSVAEGKDTLALLPTGGGKSITFQVPGLATEGMCLVITPLIALMKDQVENLQRRNISAYAIHSGLTFNELNIVLNDCQNEKYKFLYLSPERLTTELFLNKLQKMKINLIAVDESHCISQWGYDFRPSYLKISEIRKFLPKVPILAVTATATPEVVEDIQKQLKFKTLNVFSKSFERKNLTYIVRFVEDKINYILRIASKQKGTGIVYVRNRKKTKEVAQYLQSRGVSADYYHAGLEIREREHKQNQWKSGKCRFMVCTNAFGMGIDKPDVRVVIHLDLPDTIEAYFQEAGRAGRDELSAYAVILYDDNDVKSLKDSVDITYPPIPFIKSVYHALGNFFQLPIGYGKGQSYDFQIADFAGKYDFPVLETLNALKFLQREGYIELTDEVFSPARMIILLSPDDFYKFRVENRTFDPLLVALTRQYTGLFTEYTPIKENDLSFKVNAQPDVIKKYLLKLTQMGAIDYLPQKKSPMLIYSTDRVDNKDIQISAENYERRKQLYIKKIQAVIDYVTSKHHCRSHFLLEYFGQHNPPLCEQCDVCKRKDERELSEEEFYKIANEITKSLTVSTYTYEELIAHSGDDENHSIKVLQWLFDSGKIKYNEENKIVNA